MQRTIILTIEDNQRTQEELDIAALKLIDSIQETQFRGVALRISRLGKFCIKASILQTAPTAATNVT